MVSKKPFDFGQYADDALDARFQRALSRDLNDAKVQKILAMEDERRIKIGKEPVGLNGIQGYKADIGEGKTTVLFYLSVTGVEMLIGERNIEWQYHIGAVNDYIEKYLVERGVQSPTVEVAKLDDTSDRKKVVSVAVIANEDELKGLYSTLVKANNYTPDVGLP